MCEAKELNVAQPQLLMRSARARDLAHRLARREHRSITDVVERALEGYEGRGTGREPASECHARLAKDYGADIDPEEIIRDSCQSTRARIFDLRRYKCIIRGAPNITGSRRSRVAGSPQRAVGSTRGDDRGDRFWHP